MEQWYFCAAAAKFAGTGGGEVENLADCFFCVYVRGTHTHTHAYTVSPISSGNIAGTHL